MINETENQVYLRRAKEALSDARRVENDLRMALAQAMEQTKMAKEKYEKFFGRGAGGSIPEKK